MQNQGLDINFMQGARDILNARQTSITNGQNEEKLRLVGEQQAVEAQMLGHKNAREDEAHGMTMAKNRQDMKAQALDMMGGNALTALQYPEGTPERAEAIENIRAVAKLAGLDLQGNPTTADLEGMVNTSKTANEARKTRQETVRVPIDNQGTEETLAPDATGAYNISLGTGRKPEKKTEGGAGGEGKWQQTTYQAANGEPVLFNPLTKTYKLAVSGATPTPQDFLPKQTNPGQGERDKLADIYTMQKQADSIEEIINKNPNFVGIGQNTLGNLTQSVNEDEAFFRAQVEDLKDSMLRMRSGAAITESEYKRLSGFVPNLNALTSETEFKGKLKRFKEILAETIKSKETAMGQSGTVLRDAAGARNLGAKTEPAAKLPQGNGAKLDKATGKAFYDAAGKDKAKAAELAQANGWSL